ncbi:class I SAM-dependent methyltransferase [Actinocatenispora rupis]|uniref:Methyltransferase n=1 Tax=Actinocatenispora rupis TaxID=519421 RepID=A0A8J3J4X6_9ACTN|nr:class I SAM-dependent methyltransferase [Actinocatenispora rupis]GID11686.1 methyltransferase [Actinocatenispora rupis]
MTGYYDREAVRYDATRGGRPRARAAATALAGLLGPPSGPVLDLAGGTGSVAAELTAAGHRVLVLDGSAGMLRLAAQRIPGRVVRGSLAALPVRTGSVSAVVAVWVLHLLPPELVAATMAEVARCLAPGGRFVSTVDKRAANHGTPRDPDATDCRDTVTRLAVHNGLTRYADGGFAGHGQRTDAGATPWYPLLCLGR